MRNDGLFHGRQVPVAAVVYVPASCSDYVCSVFADIIHQIGVANRGGVIGRVTSEFFQRVVTYVLPYLTVFEGRDSLYPSRGTRDVSDSAPVFRSIMPG